MKKPIIVVRSPQISRMVQGLANALQYW